MKRYVLSIMWTDGISYIQSLTQVDAHSEAEALGIAIQDKETREKMDAFHYQSHLIQEIKD